MTTRDMAATIEDAEWMIKAGEFPDRIAHRLGYRSYKSVQKMLTANGRPELAARLAQLDHASVAFVMAHPIPTDGDRATRKVPA